jgi:hypothetical protein
MSVLIEEFKSLKNDEERWTWLAANQGKGLLVMCDNDITMLSDENDNTYTSFDEYIGYSEGVFSLLKSIGIDAQSE